MDVTPKDATDYLMRLQVQIDEAEQNNRQNPVHAMMQDYRDAALNGNDQTRRRFIDNPPDHTVFYRKMNRAEWDSAIKQSGTYDFTDPFQYTNTQAYRLWLSTSLDKVRVFGNASASSSSDVIVMFVFSDTLLNRFPIKAHQESGVQGNASVVAMHREGFPALLVPDGTVPNLNSDAHVAEVKRQNKAYNLGFTSQQAVALNKLLERSELLG
jgi:hypothetical protein